MKYSIIIPIYKVEKYLRQCVDSVLTQTYTDYEIILVDDGSPDSCPGICDEYAASENRIRVIHKPNGGLSDARNAGLDIAQGDYIIFLDSDDWWSDANALAKIDSCLLSTKPEVLIFGMKKFFSLDNRIGDIRIPKKLATAPKLTTYSQTIQQYMRTNSFLACACDKVIRRDLIERGRQRFVKGQYSEDIEWCCKLLMKEPRVELLEEAFYTYRQQVATSISANVSPKNIKSIVDVIKRYACKDASLPLLHFLANQYVLLITNLMRLTKEEQRPFNPTVKQFWWLLDYDWYPYVRKVSKVKFLGYGTTSNLLRLYYYLIRK